MEFHARPGYPPLRMLDRAPSEEASGGRGDFTATRWTEVALAGDSSGSAAAREALERLCARYWPAVYGFLRRKNYAPDDAADLTQGFFTVLIEENAFARADRSRGRFRSFLLGALQRFLADEKRREGAKKRGGGASILRLDFQEMEEGYLAETDPALTPDQVYDRQWASAILDSAFEDLRLEFQEAGEIARFDSLKRVVSEEAADGDYDVIAARLGLSVKSVSSAVARLRERYRAFVRRTVFATVCDSDEVDSEFSQLFQ